MNTVFDPIRQKLELDLLKFAVSRAIFCRCGDVMDFRRAVLAESPHGNTVCVCNACWTKGLEKIHDDNPEQYLIERGYKVIRSPKRTSRAKKSA